ncbi:hypothetical protein PUMCH_002293 [Australozyma saopauloensis]|uniref:NEDD8-activating enzyme E1 catalytic subunit n=1 Tax=Australozyma saopauloensis TaxID=291208 RepID=A0AAX4H941_9ASCO|nr:hypothetical protein PUMCH_002293 [[Candida] saopauloensis]
MQSLVNSSITPLLNTPGPFNEFPGEFSPLEAVKALKETRVLMIGAGGLGCEILKNLVFTGFRKIDIIDMDTIDVSNLNRQFLFRESDIGKSKAEAAAAFLRRRIKDESLEITSHFCAIQEKDQSFYRQFSVVICGLDNVEARRWINALLVGMVDSALNNLIPMVDGGTEGFRGQSRVIIPTVTSCFECSLDMLSPKLTYPVCTIANTPRLPEHCIEWASQLEWPRRFGDRKFDADIPEDVDLMHSIALARAKEFGIANVTRSLTLGVVKNIIPAIASTNAIIAASCCNEVFKLVTSCNPVLDNYMMYSGDESIFTYTYAHAKKANCPVCGTEVRAISALRWWTLRNLIDVLKTKQEFLLKLPSVAKADIPLYIALPEHLRLLTENNLNMKLIDLVSPGEEVVVTDANLPISMRLLVSKYDGPDVEPQDISSLLKS